MTKFEARIGVLLPADLRQEIENLAAQEYITISDIVRRTLLKYLEIKMDNELERNKWDNFTVTDLRKIGKLLQIENYSRISREKLIKGIKAKTE